MISSLMFERQTRRDSVIAEISEKWGGSQIITGPYITIPYKTFYKDVDDKLIPEIEYLHLLPKTLKIDGNINPKIRYRSNYEVVLYNTEITVRGIFDFKPIEKLNIKTENIMWDKANICIGISDMRGIQDNILFKFNEVEKNFSPGVKTQDIVTQGVSSQIILDPMNKTNAFSIKLNVNGSSQLQFIPIGEETTVKLVSKWPSPSFNGAFLPYDRQITDKGFNAAWKILQLNRNFPQAWKGSQHEIGSSSFGLGLLISNDIYQKSERLSKYAIMFIIFTFAAFFISEIISKKRIHPIQYLLVGLAISLFYILQLSISEHLSFNNAYMISAGAITALITGYANGIIQSKYFTVTIFSVLVSLYTYLYIVIQLEDFSLIMGSMSLFVVLAVIMFMTRNINWYAFDGKKIEEV